MNSKITPAIKKIIEENALALATVDEEGNPHVIAVGDVKVIPQNQLLIGDNYMKKTIKNIKRDNKVALAVWNRNWEESCVGYKIKGVAEYFTSGKWHEMVKKIHQGFPTKGAIVVKVNKIIKSV